jgi:hypothetical protein
MAKKNPRRSANSQAALKGIPVGDPDAPAEHSDAGPADDLTAAYVAEQVRRYRSKAIRKHAAAQGLIAHSRRRADTEARAALDSATRAFWWAENTSMEEEQHLLLHRIGRWTRRNLGCQLHFDGETYSHRCPVAIAHKRMGFSVGIIAKRFCSLCDGDLSECEHIRGRSYWIRGGAEPGLDCRVCLRPHCRHRTDRLYRAPVVSIIKEVDELREISWVRRPAHPEARLVALPVSTDDRAEAPGGDFSVGVPVSCDRCLDPCPGIDDPFARVEVETELEPSP